MSKRMSCHVMSCHVMSCHVMSCHVMSCHVMSCHVMSCHVMSCHVMSCHVMSCHVMSCHVMSCHVMSCHVMSCHVMSCHVILLHRRVYSGHGYPHRIDGSPDICQAITNSLYTGRAGAACPSSFSCLLSIPGSQGYTKPHKALSRFFGNVSKSVRHTALSPSKPVMAADVHASADAAGFLLVAKPGDLRVQHRWDALRGRESVGDTV